MMKIVKVQNVKDQRYIFHMIYYLIKHVKNGHG